MLWKVSVFEVEKAKAWGGARILCVCDEYLGLLFTLTLRRPPVPYFPSITKAGTLE